MTTEDEELQTKEFLKRAEVKTMKKDLQKLREIEALKEREKIVKVKTLEEEKLEREKKRAEEKESLEKKQREKVLQKSLEEEREAEKQIKDYAEESERQQIFILEAQRVGLEKQIQTLEKEKEPPLMLEKNKILLEKKDWEAKLNTILGEERKIESEQKFISEKEKESNVPSEKQSLEKRRWELEDQRQKIEKKRWEIERQLVGMENKVKEIDENFQKILDEKAILKEKIAGIDRTLREIYSKIIQRVEERKRGQAEEQKLAALKKAEEEAKRKERIQREQWAKPKIAPREKEFIKEMPSQFKEKLAKTAEVEEEQRKKFLKDIEEQTSEENK